MVLFYIEKGEVGGDIETKVKGKGDKKREREWIMFILEFQAAAYDAILWCFYVPENE